MHGLYKYDGLKIKAQAIRTCYTALKMNKAILLFDKHITAQLLRLPSFFKPYFAAVTWVGSPFITMSLTSVAAVVAALLQNGSLFLLCVAVAGAILASNVLKISVRRPRPETPYSKAMPFKTFSFPSGHAFSSLLVYGIACLIIADFISLTAAVMLFILLAVLIISIGLSRVYLGAHYASDVAGGWVLSILTLVVLLPLIRAV